MDDAHSRRGFRRFEFARPERQLDRSRILLAGGVAIVLLTVGAYVGSQGVRSAVSWLHRQPQYQIRFLNIQLGDEPPTWFRGGADAFLRRVRENAREDEILPVLDLPRDRIELDFKQFPWVDSVLRVEYPPQRIVVHLAYKKPVAVIPHPDGEDALLDSKGHLLPAEDVDLTRLGPLIKIGDRGLAHSAQTQSGHRVWRSTAQGLEGERQGRAVLRAARLAGFLQDPDRASEVQAIPALRILAIWATDPRGLFVQTAEGNMVLWGDAPGEEVAGGIEASEKWELLKKWAKSDSGRSLPQGDFWAFIHSELKPVETGRGRG
jgi:hypothetical protein